MVTVNTNKLGSAKVTLAGVLSIMLAVRVLGKELIPSTPILPGDKSNQPCHRHTPSGAAGYFCHRGVIPTGVAMLNSFSVSICWRLPSLISHLAFFTISVARSSLHLGHCDGGCIYEGSSGMSVQKRLSRKSPLSRSHWPLKLAVLAYKSIHTAKMTHQLRRRNIIR